MVDCNRQRCVQERRSFRRELLSWVKNVPILVGLEEVSRTLLGKDITNTLLEPFYDLEPSVVDDWRPQTRCQFCDEETTVGHDVSHQTSEELSETVRARGEFLKHISRLNSLHANGFTLTPDEPLDLSALSNHSDTDEILSNQIPVELKVPQIHSKHGRRRDNSGKRNYTDEELSAAVSDIRSGKLGTRRASALYGVPRSTLRNKIFRLDSSSPQSWNDASHHDLPPKSVPDGHLVTDLGDWEKRLQQLRRKHDLGAGHKRPFGMPPLFFSNEHFLECQKAFSCSNPYLYDLKLPFLRQLVEKLTEERVSGVKLGQVDHNWLQGSAVGDTEELFGGFTNVELQIPSYKPTRGKCQGAPPAGRNLSHGVVDSGARPNRTIGESLKDIIAKSIAQKVRTRALLNNTSDASPARKFISSPDFCRRESVPKANGQVRESSESAPEVKQPKLAVKVSRASVVTREEEEGERGRRHKQTRPKRGQYRKYNSQLLMEAVQSVQRGEMSVHRAGSFYGVPHSTLEYKVKERHLLRQKKARDNQMKSNDEVTSDDSAQLPEMSSATDDPLPMSLYPMSRPLTLGWPSFAANGSAAVPSGGFLPYESEFGLNTSASELLKKLQQKVEASSVLKTSVDDDIQTNIATSAGVGGDVTVK